jgi:hypothetical protein
MLVDRFKDLPMVFLSSKYDEPVDEAGLNAVRKVIKTISIDKRTGKRILEKSDDTASLPGQFHTIEVDHQNAAVAVVAARTRLIYYLGDSPPKQLLSRRADGGRGFLLDEDVEEQPALRRPLRRAMVAD